jgi:hypothetical protein
MLTNSKKRKNKTILPQPTKKNATLPDNTPFEEPQWVDLGNNKTSWIWKYFGVKTNGRAYCKYILNKNEEEMECGWSCVYNSQTSSMNHHLGAVHKEYEREKLVRNVFLNLILKILNLINLIHKFFRNN